jgi:hypothetical protein
MSRGDGKSRAALVDFVAQSIQTLHSDRRLRKERPLLRIDNLEDAAQAPFQFDAASGRLHRRGCRSISARSRHALYGLWRIDPEERKLACSRCKPVPMEKEPENRSDATDMLFGLVSLIDQFGSVLRERGQEYRESEDGHQLSRQFEGLFQRLDRREQDFLSTLLTSMDGLITAVRDMDSRLNNSNGEDKANGHDKDEADPVDEA